MNKDAVRRLLIIVSVIATIVVNGLATALPINGQTTGEISDSFDVFFVPAGYVFSIWGIIYLGLVVYAAYQAMPAQAHNRDLRRIGYLFVLSSLVNVAWILLWHYEVFPLTVLVMLVLLACLIAIYSILDIGRKQVSGGMRWLVHLPFSIYLGWITVATVVGGLVSFTRGDIAYAAVLIWAFVGIAVKHGDTSTVATSAWAATVATAILLIAGTIVHRRRLGQPVPVV